jgi:hypothetical protein
MAGPLGVLLVDPAVATTEVEEHINGGPLGPFPGVLIPSFA